MGAVKKKKQNEKKADESETMRSLVGNGSVDFRGRTADKRKTGGWKAAPFIIVSEVAEKMAGFAVGVNSMVFWTTVMHYSLPDAIANTAALGGIVSTFTTILGAFLADSYWGRFKTILIFSCIHALGMLMLALTASLDSLHPPPCNPKAGDACRPASKAQIGFLLAAKAVITVGSCGMKPSISPFGADQFDETDRRELPQKYSFFNWFFLMINMGAFFAITFLVHLREYKGWSWGFGVPAAATFFSVFVFAAGFPKYRFRKPLGSAITRFLQVIVASLRKHRKGVRIDYSHQINLYEVGSAQSDIRGIPTLAHTDEYRFLDKAAVITEEEAEEGRRAENRWKLCTVMQVEELKSFLRVFPIWATTIAVFVPFSQLHSFFLGQAMLMDRSLSPTYVIPAGSVPIFGLTSVLVLVPIYGKVLVPAVRRFTLHPRGITTLQRIGVGLFFAFCSMVTAALVEKRRHDSLPSPSSVFWLFPQFALVGAGETFAHVGLMEFFYDEATDSTRSLSNAVFMTEMGIAGFLNSMIVKTIQKTTGGEQSGWLRSDLNKSKLDNFYWILATISIVNLFAYVWAAMRFKGKDGASGSVRDVSTIEMVGHGGREDDEKVANHK